MKLILIELKVFLIILLLGFGMSGTNCSTEESTLSIVTSFPKDLTTSFKKAFEDKNENLNVTILNKSTSSSIKYIQETASKNNTDLFWASAPDAFEVLKDSNLLEKHKVNTSGIPDKIGSFPINDPDGYYKGFAAAGYGIMWNTRYTKAKELPAPKDWEDLKKPVYFNHVAMSAPSRSGTTHLTLETILQSKGWAKGWETMKFIAGNFRTVTERSFGVPDGVNSGDFGIGIVIDFFGLSSKGAGFPVEFIYPPKTSLVPANIAIIKNAPNKEMAVKFIDFLLSDEGQEILLDPKIRRLPVNPKTYTKAPKHFPNPFTDSALKTALYFDLNLSKSRYNLINSLFDVMITYRMEALRKATKAIHDASGKLNALPTPNSKAKALIDEAKELLVAVPIDEATANDVEFSKIFTKKRKKATDKVTGRQAEVEAKWDEFIQTNYKRAEELAKKASSIM